MVQAHALCYELSAALKELSAALTMGTSPHTSEQLLDSTANLK